MLKRLRIKFIALNMATVAMVLLVVFSAICLINYQQGVNSVYAALSEAVNYADVGAGRLGDTDKTLPDNQTTSSQDFTPPNIGGDPGGKDTHVPVAVYIIDSSGEARSVVAVASAALSDEVLSQATSALEGISDGAGELSSLGLFYEKRSVDDGSVHVAFADVSAASGWRSLAVTLVLVGFATLAIFFVISLFFSRWALRPVQEAWTQQRQFVADASHELKTPLTVILANNSILMSHPERTIASQNQWLESTQVEGERMQALVADLLLLAQMDAEAGGTAAIESQALQRVDFSHAVEGELLQFESVAFERGITLESEVEGDLAVEGNPERLRRLITTLLDNACKYADEGGTVKVTLARAGGAARLTVFNTGTAISEADLSHLFDRFYRADKARTQEIGGYGLGLSIAREVAEEHKGTIEVKSVEGEGTTFCATVPLMTASS